MEDKADYKTAPTIFEGGHLYERGGKRYFNCYDTEMTWFFHKWANSPNGEPELCFLPTYTDESCSYNLEDCMIYQKDDDNFTEDEINYITQALRTGALDPPPVRESSDREIERIGQLLAQTRIIAKCSHDTKSFTGHLIAALSTYLEEYLETADIAKDFPELRKYQERN